MFAVYLGVALLVASPPGLVLRGGLVVDGTGSPAQIAHVRIAEGRIAEVGAISVRPGDRVIDVTGLIVAPGFIDAHSHADGGIREDPTAVSQLRQGITTAIVGQDGYWLRPVAEHLSEIAEARPALNFASFSGHGGIRRRVMGDDYRRAANAEETARMATLVEADMQAGALGLSTGLEYDPGYYASTEEVIALARVAARHRGIYISHLRDEGNAFFEALDELIRVAREAGLPAQVSHIKLGTAAVWGKAEVALRRLAEARAAGLDITADVYPYLYWQSTVTALTPSRDWDSPEVWERGFADVGGPANVLLSDYPHEPAWVGKTLAEIAEATGRSAVAIVQEIVRRVHGEGGSGTERVVVTAMTEPDLEAFLRDPHVMFCSDGAIGGSHPRGAGSFPRILGRYVRERGVLDLPEAIRKATSLPARRFGLTDRGVLRAGMAADIVVFDPRTIADRATPASPRELSVGVHHVIVNGEVALEGGEVTGRRPGRILRSGVMQASERWQSGRLRRS